MTMFLRNCSVENLQKTNSKYFLTVWIMKIYPDFRNMKEYFENVYVIEFRSILCYLLE